MPRIRAILLHLVCIARKLCTGRPIAFHLQGIKRALFSRPMNEPIAFSPPLLVQLLSKQIPNMRTTDIVQLVKACTAELAARRP